MLLIQLIFITLAIIASILIVKLIILLSFPTLRYKRYLKIAKAKKNSPRYKPTFKIARFNWQEIHPAGGNVLISQDWIECELENATKYPLCNLAIELEIITEEDKQRKVSKLIELLLPGERTLIKDAFEDLLATAKCLTLRITDADIDIKICEYQWSEKDKQITTVNSFLDVLDFLDITSEQLKSDRCEIVANKIKNLLDYKTAFKITRFNWQEMRINALKKPIMLHAYVKFSIENICSYPLINLNVELDFSGKSGEIIEKVLKKINLLLPDNVIYIEKMIDSLDTSTCITSLSLTISDYNDVEIAKYYWPLEEKDIKIADNYLELLDLTDLRGKDEKINKCRIIANEIRKSNGYSPTIEVGDILWKEIKTSSTTNAIYQELITFKVKNTYCYPLINIRLKFEILTKSEKIYLPDKIVDLILPEETIEVNKKFEDMIEPILYVNLKVIDNSTTVQIQFSEWNHENKKLICTETYSNALHEIGIWNNDEVNKRFKNIASLLKKKDYKVNLKIDAVCKEVHFLRENRYYERDEIVKTSLYIYCEVLNKDFYPATEIKLMLIFKHGKPILLQQYEIILPGEKKRFEKNFSAKYPENIEAVLIDSELNETIERIGIKKDIERTFLHNY